MHPPARYEEIAILESSNRKAVGLMLQLRLAARHLEDAIDNLLPQDEP
jgi:hypothetical protein